MLSQIDIYRFRNIGEAQLNLDRSNLIVGLNGSGKTSVLESLHLLAYGKSFRSHNIDSIIQYDASDLIVSGRFNAGNAGVQRFRNGKFSIRLNGQDVAKVSELSRLLPTHVIEPNSVALVEGAPSERRRFLDFTMFHVEHDYLETHKLFNDALKQRNALLKHPEKLAASQKPYWDELFCQTAWELHVKRQSLFNDVLLPKIEASFGMLLGGLDIKVSYDSGCRGARSEQDLAQILKQTADQELRFRATQIGPHRADILFKHKEKLAKDYLSRGQKKLLTYGVRLAPAMVLAEMGKDVGQILIDDMPSELDEHSVEKVCALLNQVQGQVLLTAVDETNRQVQIINEMLAPKMFHVEHGCVQR